MFVSAEDLYSLGMSDACCRPCGPLWSCDVGGASSVVSGIIKIHKIQLFPRALKQCFYTFLHFNIRVIACLWHMPKHLGLHNSAMKAAILQILSRSHTEISNESIADDARILHLGADVLAHRVCDDKAYHFERGESRCHALRVHFQLGQMHQLSQLQLGVHRDMSASWVRSDTVSAWRRSGSRLG